MKAVIAGAGVGGLMAALCLRHSGWAVTVLEQAPDLREVGAGIQISPNGANVLHALGLLAAVETVAFKPERIEMRLGQSGAMVFSIPLGSMAVERWGAPYLHVHRADLLTVLQDALNHRAPDALRTHAHVVRYDQTSDGVTATLGDGATMSGDVLVGADGIHSTIRTQMCGAEAPRFTGCAAWRAVVPMSALGEHVPPPTACVWVGEGRHAVTYRLRNGELANFVGVVECEDWRTESWSDQGAPEEALSDFAGWHPVITEIIGASSVLHRWALFDREPLSRWTDGRVALLGDACHPMLPFMAQGAVMAMEDAWVLAATLHQSQDIPAALLAYQSLRMPRTSKVQAAARANTGIFHQRTTTGKLLTYGPMWLAARMLPSVVHARQDWIYGEDVTANLFATT